MRAIRANWPRTQILLRGDSHYCCPEFIDWCRAGGHDFILGVAPTSTLRRHVTHLEASTRVRFKAAPADSKKRCIKAFHDGVKSGSRAERIIARVEVDTQGVDTRFIVTNLKKGPPRWFYNQVYCRRIQAENHIKSWKRHLAADRTSCSRATANPLRLFLHAGACWLMCCLRTVMPKRSIWRSVKIDTLSPRLIKIAALVTELKKP